MSTASGFQIGRGAPHFYELHVHAFMAPFVDALVAATVAPGNAVLDVASGTGFATRAASAAAGVGSRVEGCDINAAMLAQAQSMPGPEGSPLAWREASALDLPYADGEFDAVICQQGVQFFPDPAAGFREMARVTKPGGRVGATAWSQAHGSPFLDHETAMLARHGGGAQAAFAATDDQLQAWCADAGLGDVAIERIEAHVELAPVQEFVPQHLQALPWSASFFELPATQQEQAIAELAEALSDYETPSGIKVPFNSYLVTATI